MQQTIWGAFRRLARDARLVPMAAAVVVLAILVVSDPATAMRSPRQCIQGDGFIICL